MRPPPGYENIELRKPEIDLDLDPFDIYNADNADTTLGSPNSSGENVFKVKETILLYETSQFLMS